MGFEKRMYMFDSISAVECVCCRSAILSFRRILKVSAKYILYVNTLYGQKKRLRYTYSVEKCCFDRLFGSIMLN